MGLQTTNNELNAKAVYKAGGFISISPVSKGTWTVRAATGKKQKNFTGLSFDELTEGFYQALLWLDEQTS